MPDINEEILEAWAQDTDLTILQQDEDLMIANAMALPLLAVFVRRRDIPNSKRRVLLSAICVIVYDNMPDSDGRDSGRSQETVQSAVSFLAENRELFEEIGDEYICDYIKEAVYPLIGFGRRMRPGDDCQ